MAALERGARSGVGIGAIRAAAGWWSTAGTARRPDCRRSSAGCLFPGALARGGRARSAAPGRAWRRREQGVRAACRRCPPRDAAHLCRLVLMKALPAAAEDDLVSFGIGDQRDAARPRRLFRADARRPTLHQSRRCGGPAASRGARRMRDRAELVGADRLCLRRRREAQANQLAAIARQHPAARVWTSASARGSIAAPNHRASSRLPECCLRSDHPRKPSWRTRTSCTW